jgi:hypothetical protein
MVVSSDNEERPGDAHGGTGASGENFTVNPPKPTDSSWIGGRPLDQPKQPGTSTLGGGSAGMGGGAGVGMGGGAGAGGENFTVNPPKITGSPWINVGMSPDQPGQPGKQRIISFSAHHDLPSNSTPFTSGQPGWRSPANAVLPTEVLVYTAADDGEDLRDAVVDVLELCGFEIVLRMEPERGSWSQRLSVFRRDSRAADKLVEVLQKVERAAELKHIAAPRSESDEREANAVARLAEALGGHDEVVVRLSSVLFVKSGGRVVARVLTEDEIRVLDENPQLMRSPTEILEGLPRLRETAGLPSAAATEDAGQVSESRMTARPALGGER